MTAGPPSFTCTSMVEGCVGVGFAASCFRAFSGGFGNFEHAASASKSVNPTAITIFVTCAGAVRGLRASIQNLSLEVFVGVLPLFYHPRFRSLNATFSLARNQITLLTNATKRK